MRRLLPSLVTILLPVLPLDADTARPGWLRFEPELHLSD